MDFTITWGTLFASHKLPLKGYLATIAIFCNEAEGKSMLALSRDLGASTLEAVFATPVQASIAWRDIEALFVACGAEISEGEGSRVRVALKGVRAVFHRPHPARKPTRERCSPSAAF